MTSNVYGGAFSQKQLMAIFFNIFLMKEFFNEI